MMDMLDIQSKSKVIEIDGARFEKTQKNKCEHKHMQYDTSEETIDCLDCGLRLNHFKAFALLVEKVNNSNEKIRKDIEKLRLLEQQTVVLKAAKDVESAWRRKNMVPTCPHCDEAIFPEDGFGRSSKNKQMELLRRKKFGNPRHRTKQGYVSE